MVETHLLLPRKKEIKLLMNHIEAGNCAFIFGLPFIGKTVLAQTIYEKLKTKDQVLALYINLEHFEGETTDALLDSIILETGKVIPGSNVYSIPEKGSREYHLNKLLASLPFKKIVILLDSAEGLKKLSGWNIFLPTIRALHLELGVVFLLFSRIRPHQFAEDPISSPAINIFEANLVKLNLLPKDVVDSVSNYLVSNGIEVETVFPDFLWRHTGGHPFLIKIYLEIYGLEKSRHKFLDSHDFNVIKEKAEAKLQEFYKELFAVLKSRDRQIIANDVLEGKISKYRDKYLHNLEELGILRQSPEGYQLFSLGARKYFQRYLLKRAPGGKYKFRLSARKRYIAALSLVQLLGVLISLLAPGINNWFDRLSLHRWKWLIIILSFILFIVGCIFPLVKALRSRKKAVVSSSDSGRLAVVGDEFEDRTKLEPPVSCQKNSLYHNSWALVVGINSYEQRGIPNLIFAEDDARAVASCLSTLGFPGENIKLLLGERHEVTREAILDILETRFNPGMNKEDRFLFYFAGHGISCESGTHKRGYLLMQSSGIFGKWPTPQDPYLKKIPSKALEMQWFLDIVQSLPVKHKLVLIDSCFSGFMTHSRDALDRGVMDINKKLTQWTSEPVTQVLTAGRSGQISYEKECYQHGVFTWYLLKGLQGNADPRGDGIISFLDLATYIRERVSRENGVDQDPQIGVFGDGQFVFVYK